jgi:hypothetical protein
MPTHLPEALLERLVDDAAVFPPGNAPLARAVADHVARTAYRRYVGDLLVPASDAAHVLGLVGESPLSLVLVSRPGMPVGPVRAAVTQVRAAAGPVRVAGVEVGWGPGWRDLLDLGVAVTVEIPRQGRDAALDEVATARSDVLGTPAIRAKLRTGATADWAWPDEHELAALIRAVADLEIPVKLTGGLHHAVRADHTDGPQHGVLNVLAAMWLTLNFGSTPDVAHLLSLREPRRLLEDLLALGPHQARGLRHMLVSYGCCGVLDPIGELVALGLVPPEGAGTR